MVNRREACPCQVAIEAAVELNVGGGQALCGAAVLENAKKPRWLFRSSAAWLVDFLRRRLQAVDDFTNVFLGLAEALLQAAVKLVFLAVGEGEIVVGELTVFLFQFAFEFVPIAFEG